MTPLRPSPRLGVTPIVPKYVKGALARSDGVFSEPGGGAAQSRLRDPFVQRPLAKGIQNGTVLYAGVGQPERWSEGDVAALARMRAAPAT